MAQFNFDDYTGTAGANIAGRTPTGTGAAGGPWTQHTGAGTTAVITAAGRIRPGGNGSASYGYLAGVPASPDYDVYAVVAPASAGNFLAGVIGRLTTSLVNGYGARLNNGTWELIRYASGATTTLGTSTTSVPGAGATATVMLRMVGTAISLLVNGTVLVGPVTDATYTAAGLAGFQMYCPASTSDSVGYHLDDFGSSDTTALTAGTLSLASSSPAGIALATTEAIGGTGPYTRQWYASQTAGFTPGAGNLLAGATGLTFTDTTPREGEVWYYKVAFTDSAGTPATATSAQFSATLDASAILKHGFLGDSLLALLATGTNGTVASYRVPYAYANRLAMMSGVRQVAYDSGAPVLTGSVTYNQAVGGKATSDYYTAGAATTALVNARAAFVTLGATDVHVLFGANDSSSVYRLSAATYKANLAGIASYLLGGAGILRVWLHCPIFYTPGLKAGSTTFDDTGIELVRQYQSAPPALANGASIRLGDTTGFALFAQFSTRWQIDYLHPNAEGAEVLATLLAQPYYNQILKPAPPAGGAVRANSWAFIG